MPSDRAGPYLPSLVHPSFPPTIFFSSNFGSRVDTNANLDLSFVTVGYSSVPYETYTKSRLSDFG